MEPNAAAENLQVIRTLMERSALYRRALAPVMLAAGVLGLAGWFVGEQLQMNSLRAFVVFWFAIAFVVIGVALLIVRRQALSSQEPFWTPPTRQVAKAMTPPLVAGFLIPLSQCVAKLGLENAAGLDAAGLDVLWPLPMDALWPLLYGCALHSAGLFVSRGVRQLGWAFILSSIVIGYFQLYSPMGFDFDGKLPIWLRPHAMMGLTFGGLHLIAAVYLYVTEKRKNAQ